MQPQLRELCPVEVKYQRHWAFGVIVYAVSTYGTDIVLV